MSIDSTTSPDKVIPFFNLEEMTQKAREYTTDAKVSEYIIKILNTPEFWQEPQKYLDEKTQRNRRTEQYLYPQDDSFMFWLNNFPKS